MNDQKAPAGREALISSLQAGIHRCLQPYIDEGPVAIVDFPDIRNCGDSAIWLGEMAYLQGRHAKRPSYVSRIYDFSVEELNRRVPSGTIFIHGGGNFGDIWVAHQDFREHVIESFPDRRIVQFPQSILFKSEQRLDQAARIIAKHRHFTLLVRDRESLELARAKFDCEVELCPDMAFCIGPVERLREPVFPVLAMLREDAEKTGTHNLSALAGIPIQDWITESRFKVRVAKARGIASAILGGRREDVALEKLDAAARQRFRRGVMQLSQARAIVTDRLHVHIVSLLMGLPHAVLDNNYGKVRRFMSAFSGGTDLSFLPDNMAEAVAWAKERAREADLPR